MEEETDESDSKHNERQFCTPQRPSNTQPNFASPRSVEEARLLVEYQQLQHNRHNAWEQRLYKQRKETRETIKLMEQRIMQEKKRAHQARKEKLLEEQVTCLTRSLAAELERKMKEIKDQNDSEANLHLRRCVLTVSTAYIVTYLLFRWRPAIHRKLLSNTNPSLAWLLRLAGLSPSMVSVAPIS